MSGAVSYPFRRLWHWFLSPDLACRYRWCARRRVGLSVWCREHTDRIMAGEDIDGWPRQGRASAADTSRTDDGWVRCSTCGTESPNVLTLRGHRCEVRP